MTKKRIIRILLIVAGLVIVFFIFKPKKTKVSYETIEVKQGDLQQEITASGTLEALNTIEVGTQVSGIISKVYVDFNDHVKKGQVIAEIDKTSLRTAVQDAQATVMRNEVAVEQKKKEWERNKILLEQKSISEVESENSWFEYQTAVSNLRSSQSQLSRAQVNIQYASIVSPVNGVVLSRTIDEGQTVAASFNTPTLFTIAQDLTQMEVLADIDEADIGQVKVNQDAIFTVDAYPNSKFKGTVKQIRLQPNTTQNVVTYTIIISVINKDYKLMPGMTANVSIIVNRRENVLMVSQAAFRFIPGDNVAEVPTLRFISLKDNKLKNKLINTPLSEGVEKLIWKIKNDTISPVIVKVGINDGSEYEISGKINPGEKVLTELNTGNEAPAQGKNPFMPQMQQKKK